MASKPLTSTQRTARFRAAQLKLGRTPRTHYLTDEEQLLTKDFVENLRKDMPPSKEPVAVGSYEYASVRELLRIMRMSKRNPAVTDVDLSLCFKLHTKKSLGINPVSSIRLLGKEIKGLNYDD